jgi:Ca2+-binding EF-hand superfamily protein
MGALAIALLAATVPSAIAAEKAKPNMILSDGQISEMFKMLDADKDGKVSLEELFLAIKSGKLGLLHSETGCRAFMKAADSNADGHISMKEFTQYVRKREADLTKVFKEIDKDGDGKLSTAELRTYLERALVKKVSLDDAAMLMRKIDTDKSGSIELGELVRATLFSVTSFSEAFDAWKDYVYHLFFPRQTVRRTDLSQKK